MKLSRLNLKKSNTPTAAAPSATRIALIEKYINVTMSAKDIYYSDKYFDDEFEYR